MNRTTALLPPVLDRVLKNALEGQPPSQEECVSLLAFPAESLEAGIIRAVGDAVSRQRFKNQAMLLGQIGIETAPCPGNCGFCVFGEDHTQFSQNHMPLEEIISRAKAFADQGDLYALFLMTMHTFDFGNLLNVIKECRRCIPSQTQIVVNIGDFNLEQARLLKSAGVQGAYHVCRLREGIDTDIPPAQRQETFRVIRNSGLDLYYCCEPIGPEHTPQELVEQIFLGIKFGCFQHAAMRRVAIPGLPFSSRGQISELRLGQVVAVISLATLGCRETQNIAVHEPNLIGLTSGANVVYAESGANPRDTVADTAVNRGLDMTNCRKMLYEAGFASLRCSATASRSLFPAARGASH